MTVKNKQQEVRISRKQHRGQTVVLVQFPYNKDLYKRCKALGGRYTRTYKGFWWPVVSIQLESRKRDSNHSSTGSVQCSAQLSGRRSTTVLAQIDGAQIEMTEAQLRKKLEATHTQKKKQTKSQSKASAPAEIHPRVMQKIREMERWMQQKRYSENTIATYLSFVKQFFAKKPRLGWNEVTQNLITQYNHEQFIAKKKSYSSQNQWINAIKMYLRVHGLDVGELSDIERPRKERRLPDVLTQDEIKSIFSKVSNLKHRALLMLIYSCGLRIGETLSLRTVDIRTDEGLIYIRGGKGKKDRRVPLSDRILGQLRRYYRTYHPRNYLFEGQRGGKYSNRSAAQVLRRAVKKAGIKKRVTLHTLRHSYATHLTNRGVNIQYLQEILGHSSPKTTMLYTHLSGKDIKDIRSPLDDMDM